MSDRFEVIEEDCIGCGLCSERAPENLEIPARTGIARVFKQPENAEEEQACLEASDFCPMGGLVGGVVDSPAADCSAADAPPTSIPVGDPTPVVTTSSSSRLENET
jgi:ferredoxin